MPIHRAAYKAIRSDAKKRERNQAVLSELKTRAKKLEGLISANKKSEALAYLKVMSSKYMRAVSKGIIHGNTSARKISRASKKIARLK